MRPAHTMEILNLIFFRMVTLNVILIHMIHSKGCFTNPRGCSPFRVPARLSSRLPYEGYTMNLGILGRVELGGHPDTRL